MVKFNEFRAEVRLAHQESKTTRVENIIDCLKEHFSLEGGTVTFITGPMRSGKSSFFFKFRETMSEDLEQRKVFYFKPSADTRDENIRSREYKGESIEAVKNEMAREILYYFQENNYDLSDAIVFIDEVQFYDGEIVEVIESLRLDGAHVVVSGIDTDFMARPFELGRIRKELQYKILKSVASLIGAEEFVRNVNVGDIMARATHVVKLSARTEDGRHATHSALVDQSGVDGNLKIGDEEYIPVAPNEHTEIRKMVDKFRQRIGL